MDKTEKLEKKLAELGKLKISSQFDKIAEVINSRNLKHLLSIIDRNYLTISKTNSEKVKQSTIKILASVLNHLKTDRDHYADVYYLAMSKDINKWRFRFVICE